MFRKYSITEIHQKFESGKLDPVDVAKECIDRFNRFDPLIHAWVCFDPDSLIKSALKVREIILAKNPLRSLEGIPVGIKDVFNTVDFPTQMGSNLWENFTPGNDARTVYYLKNSGAIIAGKTITAEFAVHALNDTINPHNPELTPGTSSSGSAVSVALGMVPLALGTQTGGSIIRPASFCGVYGFKPSFGLLPRTGSLKTTDSLDTIGFFVSHPSDLRRSLEVLRVRGPNFPFSYQALKDTNRQNKPTNRPWKIGFVKTHTWQYAHNYAKECLINFVEKLALNKNIEVTETNIPLEMERAHDIHATIYDKSLAYYFKEEFQTENKISEIMQEMIIRGETITTEKYHSALESQNHLINEMDSFLTNFDAVICLSTAGAAPKRNVLENPDSALMWTLTHLPAISAPLFTSPNGEPFGLQIVTRKYNDHLLMNLIDFMMEGELIPKHPYPFIE